MSFEQKVRENWSLGVMNAASNYDDIQMEVLDALHSKDSEIRLAALATMIEAGDHIHHSNAVALINDDNLEVRKKVLEYIEDEPQHSDIPYLTEALKDKVALFTVSNALNKIFNGPTIDTDDVDDEIVGILDAKMQ